VNADIAPGAAALPALNAVAVNLDNAWGVRSVAAGAGLTATVTGPANLTGPSPSLPLPLVGLASTDNPAPSRGMGALNASRTGSIDFTLDLTNLDTAGAYSGLFAIEVTSP
jgi:hypothetical protein